ncbi:hypothetical protein [Fodinibius saliphilus]|uniref:hypothetical protein n=1 Tax=Fodinibius saliphilus TaxID=1920650 RepID=UPI00110881C5|nr:hypothetical protein [Fodinibius saliphilus]
MERLQIVIAIGMLLCLTAACNVMSNEQNRDDQEEPNFEVTNDIEDRITYINSKDKGTVTVSKNSNSFSLSAIAKIAPPSLGGTFSRATHLSFDDQNNQLHVGYKMFGVEYGGGIDIIELAQPASSNGGNLISSLRSIASSNFDVQEVRFDENEEALYVGGAVAVKKEDDSPARLVKVELNNSGNIIGQKTKKISGNVVKSIVSRYSPGKSSTYVYAVNDLNDLHQFDANFGSEKELSAPDDVEFRSVAVRSASGQVFTLDRSGIVRRTNESAFNKFKETISLLPGEQLGNELSIARLQILNSQTGSDLLIAALNENGFSILNSTGSTVWNSQESLNDENYLSVTAHESSTPGNSGSDRIYTARAGGVIDVFDVPNNFRSKGLKKVGSFNLADVNGINLSGAQVNQILVHGDYLYVANSSDGVVILKVKN